MLQDSKEEKKEASHAGGLSADVVECSQKQQPREQYRTEEKRE